MKQEEKRNYHSVARQAQSQQTRSSILQAAKKLFQSEGFDRVTVGLLAKAAQVATPTIYAIFKSKRGVLQALIDEAFSPDQFAALVEKAMKETSPFKCLQLTAQLARQMYDAEKEFMDVLRGASMVCPELKELEHEREERRYERQGAFIKKLVGQNQLKSEMTFEQARDLLWAFTGRDFYRMLVIERGWSSESYETWLSQHLSDLLAPKSEQGQ